MPEPLPSEVLAGMLAGFQPLLPDHVAGLPMLGLAISRAGFRNSGIGNIAGATRMAASFRSTNRRSAWVR